MGTTNGNVDCLPPSSTKQWSAIKSTSWDLEVPFSALVSWPVHKCAKSRSSAHRQRETAAVLRCHTFCRQTEKWAEIDGRGCLRGLFLMRWFKMVYIFNGRRWLTGCFSLEDRR